MKKKQSLSLSDKIRKLMPWKIISAIVGAVLIAIYLYSILGTNDIALSITSLDSKVVVGAPFDISVSVKNISRDELANAKLSLSLPTGLVFADNPNLRIHTVNLEKIPGNGNHEEVYRVVAIPTTNVNIVAPVATLSYSRESVKGTFEQKGTLPLEIADLGLDLRLTGPAEITSNEPFTLKAVYGRSDVYTTETENIPVLKLQFNYPSLLNPTYVVPKPQDGIIAAKKLDARTFTLGTLMPGDSGEVHLKGSVDLPEGSNFKITANILINILGRDYVLMSREFSTVLSASPLSVSIYAVANDEPNEESAKAVFSAGDEVNYLLVYKNRSEIAFQEVALKVKLTGVMFDFSSMSVEGGSWDLGAKTVSWNKFNTPGFESLPPGGSGKVNFKVKLTETYPIRRLNDKNFMVYAEGRIESPTVVNKVSATKTSSPFMLENKVSGQIKVDSIGFFRDAPSFILNNGPWPPRVGEATEFTIHWVLTNYSTDVTNIDVRAQLPDGYEFTGITKSNVSTMPQFDADKREVYWKLDELYATQGVTSESPEAIFQVRATPMNVGDYMPILGQTIVTATDTFTGLQINSGDEAITSRLPDDSSIKEDEGKVTN